MKNQFINSACNAVNFIIKDPISGVFYEDTYKPNSVFLKEERIVIYLVHLSPNGSSGTLQSLGARPCIQVGILPFQPDLTGSFLFAPLRLPSTGVTCYSCPIFAYAEDKTECSDFPLPFLTATI